jgi:predicted GNAT family acetyltransferase
VTEPSWALAATDDGQGPEIQVADIPSASRFEIRVDGHLAGVATYRDGPGVRAFEHTEIAPEFEGLGLASHLIRYALDEARAAERKVRPYCPFVRSFIRRHPDYLDLVDQPRQFGLTRPPD